MSTLILNQRTMPKPQIQIKRVYKHPTEKVWTALTSPDALAKWLMKTIDFKLVEGATFQFQDKPQGGWDGIVNCKILSLDQPNSITYSWHANGMKKPTIVNWQLQQISPHETLLTLSHNGFEGVSGWVTKQILNFGWKSMMKKKLTKYLAI